jgi:cobalt/nickel transport system permease protein
MKCRGFTGRFVLLEDFRMRAQDWAFAALFLGATVLLILIELRHVLA